MSNAIAIIKVNDTIRYGKWNGTYDFMYTKTFETYQELEEIEDNDDLLLTDEIYSDEITSCYVLTTYGYGTIYKANIDSNMLLHGDITCLMPYGRYENLIEDFNSLEYMEIVINNINNKDFLLRFFEDYV